MTDDGAPVFRFHANVAGVQSRRRQMIAAHPELRQLIGPSPRSAALIVFLLVSQIAIAVSLRDQGLGLILIAAFCPGAWLAANLVAMIHEAAHGLIFRTAGANRSAALLANAALATPTAMAFFYYHRSHHARMGDYDLDVGIPTRAEAAWVRNVAWRKVLWLAAFPLFQWLRTHKFRSPERYWTGWMVANFAFQIAVNAVLFGQAGWRPLAYLLVSYSFSVGLHPLGTRVVQEHVVVSPGEETNNYAGRLRWLECNFGLHAEHHDFPRVAWHRLSQVSLIAAEFYESTPVFRSRAALLVRFITDPRYDLRNHAIR